jgi:hypothetical protein
MKSNTKMMFNSGRGPQTGNAGNKEKRDTFMSEKDERSSEKAQLANMITDALEMRGRGNRPTIKPSLENVKADTNVGRGPTKGNAGKRNSTMGKKGANGATSGY